MSHAFWEWSLQAYDRPGVRDACLDLQDRYGLNVNLCLWCAWLASEGRTARPLVSDAISRLESWSADITQAIRAVRRRLKDGGAHPQLYRAVLACELDAERVEQDMLFDLSAAAPETDDPAGDLGEALSACAAHHGSKAEFTQFVKAVFQTVKKV